MKNVLFLFCLVFLSFSAFSQFNDSIMRTFHFKHGTVKLGKNIGKITVPKGYKFLDANQSRKIFESGEIPKTKHSTFGMIFPEKESQNEDDPFYLVNVQYVEIGHVKENLPDHISKEGLIQTKYENNRPMESSTFWVLPPTYDKEKHILVWAKGEEMLIVGMLTCKIVYFGRKGILILNVLAIGDNFDLLNEQIPHFMKIFDFTKRNSYKKFKSSVDQVSSFESVEELIRNVDMYSLIYLK